MGAGGAGNIRNGAPCIHYKCEFIRRCSNKNPARIISFREQIVVECHTRALFELSSPPLKPTIHNIIFFRSRKGKHERGSTLRLNPNPCRSPAAAPRVLKFHQTPRLSPQQTHQHKYRRYSSKFGIKPHFSHFSMTLTTPPPPPPHHLPRFL